MKVILHDENGRFVGDIQITQTELRNQGELADYTVLAYADRGEGVFGLARTRITGFPVKALNPLALLGAALRSLPKETLGAEDDDTGRADNAKTQAPVPTDLERRLDRAMSALPPGLSGLRDYRSAIRSEQSEQHGDNSRGEGERTKDRE